MTPQEEKLSLNRGTFQVRSFPLILALMSSNRAQEITSHHHLPASEQPPHPTYLPEATALLQVEDLQHKEE